MMDRAERQTRQVHQYDKIFRENMEAALPFIIKHLLRIKVVSEEVLPEGLHHTKERNTDVLRKVTDSSGNRFILHIEYQAGNKSQMALRMAEYCIMALRKYKLPVRQYVIFLGKGKTGNADPHQGGKPEISLQPLQSEPGRL